MITSKRVPTQLDIPMQSHTNIPAILELPTDVDWSKHVGDLISEKGIAKVFGTWYEPSHMRQPNRDFDTTAKLVGKTIPRADGSEVHVVSVGPENQTLKRMELYVNNSPQHDDLIDISFFPQRGEVCATKGNIISGKPLTLQTSLVDVPISMMEKGETTPLEDCIQRIEIRGKPDERALQRAKHVIATAEVGIEFEGGTPPRLKAVENERVSGAGIWSFSIEPIDDEQPALTGIHFNTMARGKPAYTHVDYYQDLFAVSKSTRDSTMDGWDRDSVNLDFPQGTSQSSRFKFMVPSEDGLDEYAACVSTSDKYVSLDVSQVGGRKGLEATFNRSGDLLSMNRTKANGLWNGILNRADLTAYQDEEPQFFQTLTRELEDRNLDGQVAELVNRFRREPKPGYLFSAHLDGDRIIPNVSMTLPPGLSQEDLEGTPINPDLRVFERVPEAKEILDKLGFRAASPALVENAVKGAADYPLYMNPTRTESEIVPLASVGGKLEYAYDGIEEKLGEKDEIYYITIQRRGIKLDGFSGGTKQRIGMEILLSPPEDFTISEIVVSPGIRHQRFEQVPGHSPEGVSSEIAAAMHKRYNNVDGTFVRVYNEGQNGSRGEDFQALSNQGVVFFHPKEEKSD